MDHDDVMLMLKAITTAFDEHDLEGIMVHFADDAVFEGPRGPDPWGTRFVGSEEIREGFAARFAGIPDIRYGQLGQAIDIPFAISRPPRPTRNAKLNLYTIPSGKPDRATTRRASSGAS